MAAFLFLGDFAHRYHYSAFFHIAELIVDCCAKHSHRGRQAHISVHQGRHRATFFAHQLVEQLRIGLQVVAFEAVSEVVLVGNQLHGIDGRNQVVGVGKMLVHKI